MSSHPGGQSGTGPVFRLSGDLDFRTASSTRSALLQTVEQAPGGLVIDLQAVDFIDSSGLSLLYEAARQLERRGGRIRLRGLDTHHHRLLHTVGLAECFDLEPPVSRNGAGLPTAAGLPPAG
jgi:anti-sigma B factor antagonist